MRVRKWKERFCQGQAEVPEAGVDDQKGAGISARKGNNDGYHKDETIRGRILDQRRRGDSLSLGREESRNHCRESHSNAGEK